MIVHITEKIKLKTYTLTLFLLIMSCSERLSNPNEYRKHNKITLEFFSFDNENSADSLGYKRFKNKEFNVKLLQSESERTYIFQSGDSLTFSNEIKLLQEIFENRFIIISECSQEKGNLGVASPRLLRRYKLWVYDTNTNQLFYTNVPDILISNLPAAVYKKSPNQKHHLNSSYRLEKIDMDNKSINLLDTTGKTFQFKMIVY